MIQSAKILFCFILLTNIGNASYPVQSYLKYLSKLHRERENLWQRPKDAFYEEDPVWYCNTPIGKNSLASMMTTISRRTELSQHYTNHCIRTTAITILDEAGIS